MGIGAAIAATAAASVGSGIMQSNAAKSAARTQANAAQQAADLTHQQYLQTRDDLGPYRNFGLPALASLNSYMGTANAPGLLTSMYGSYVPTGDFVSSAGAYKPYGAYTPVASYTPFQQFSSGAQYTPPAEYKAPTYNPLTPEGLEKTPGYQFTLKQGLQAVQNANAAKGLGAGGSALRGAAEYATGLSDQTYNTRFGQNLQEYQNMLAGAGQAYQLGLTGAAQNFTLPFQRDLQQYNTNFNTNLQNFNTGLTGNIAQYTTGQQGNVTDYMTGLNSDIARYNALLGGRQANYTTGLSGDLQQKLQLYNMLMGQAGLGQNSAAQTGTLGAQNTANMTNYLAGIGQATASGIIGSANALAGGLQSGANNLTQLYLMNNLLGGGGGGVGAGAGGSRAFNPMYTG